MFMGNEFSFGGSLRQGDGGLGIGVGLTDIMARPWMVERAASVATNASQSKGKLHGIFSTTSFTPKGSFKQKLKRNSNRGRIQTGIATLFDQDFQTFKATMLLKLDQLEKQLDKEEFQEIGSFNAFRYLIAHTRTDVQQFRVTLIQHIESIKKSIEKRAQHKGEYDSKVNERQIQSKEGKVDLDKELDADLVVTESSGTKSERHDTSSRSRNDTRVEDADIKPANDKEPMA
ncbi:hypothetical protein Tco_1245372 [Tanacetum coccineum]